MQHDRGGHSSVLYQECCICEFIRTPLSLLSLLDDPSALACGRLALTDCSAVGSVLPDIDVLCKACAKARPDVVIAFQTSQNAAISS